jgi:hypothetical protein
MPLRIDVSKLMIPAGREGTLSKAMFPNTAPAVGASGRLLAGCGGGRDGSEGAVGACCKRPSVGGGGICHKGLAWGGGGGWRQWLSELGQRWWRRASGVGDDGGVGFREEERE